MDYDCNTIVIFLSEKIYACIKEEIENMAAVKLYFILCVNIYQLCGALTEKFQNDAKIQLDLRKTFSFCGQTKQFKVKSLGSKTIAQVKRLQSLILLTIQLSY